MDISPNGRSDGNSHATVEDTSPRSDVDLWRITAYKERMQATTEATYLPEKEIHNADAMTVQRDGAVPDRDHLAALERALAVHLARADVAEGMVPIEGVRLKQAQERIAAFGHIFGNKIAAIKDYHAAAALLCRAAQYRVALVEIETELSALAPGM